MGRSSISPYRMRTGYAVDECLVPPCYLSEPAIDLYTGMLTGDTTSCLIVPLISVLRAWIILGSASKYGRTPSQHISCFIVASHLCPMGPANPGAC
jgi:hypothetical protein